MKHSTILYFNRFKTINTVKENSSFIAFTVLFLLSVFAGSLLFSAGKTTLLSETLLKIFVTNKISLPFFKVFLISILTEILFLGLCYIFGTSLIGIAFIPAVIFLKGFLLGVLLANMYVNFKLQAIAYNLIIIIPATCISVLALITGACNSLNLSYCLGKLLVSEGQSENKPVLKNTLFRFLGLLAITIISALLQSVMFIAFIKYFDFGVNI